MTNNNKIVVNLDKVTHARLRYRTYNYGITIYRESVSAWPSVMGEPIYPSDIRFGTNEPMIDYAKRKNLLDVWIPELELQLSNSHSLIYTGQKAIDLWDAWNAKIFSKHKKGKK